YLFDTGVQVFRGGGVLRGQRAQLADDLVLGTGHSRHVGADGVNGLLELFCLGGDSLQGAGDDRVGHLPDHVLEGSPHGRVALLAFHLLNIRSKSWRPRRAARNSIPRSSFRAVPARASNSRTYCSFFSLCTTRTDLATARFRASSDSCLAVSARTRSSPCRAA